MLCTTVDTAFDVGGVAVSASWHGSGPVALVLSHGAGGTRHMPWLRAFADELGARGRRVLLHNFPYSEARRKRPDPAPLLEQTVRAAVALARAAGAEAVIAGGRSMGGRMASQAVAGGLAVEGLLLVAYPLHPPGQHDRLRVAHLPKVTCPSLFVQGTRDAFCRWDLLGPALDRVGRRPQLHVVEGGDHGFSMPREARRPVAEVRRGIVDAVERWIAGLDL